MKKRLVSSKPKLYRFISFIFLILVLMLVFFGKANAQATVSSTNNSSCVEITGIHIRPSSGMAAIDLTWVEAKGAGKMILVYTGLTFRTIQANNGSTYSDLLPHAGFVTIIVYSGTSKNECFSVTQIVETN